MALAELRNIGPRTAAWLIEADIVCVDDLRKLGAVGAYRRLKLVHPREVQPSRYMRCTAPSRIRIGKTCRRRSRKPCAGRPKSSQKSMQRPSRSQSP